MLSIVEAKSGRDAVRFNGEEQQPVGVSVPQGHVENCYWRSCKLAT